VSRKAGRLSWIQVIDIQEESAMVGRLLRRRVFWLSAVPVLAALLYLAFGVFGIQALWTNTRVDEDFPTSRPASVAAMAAMATPTAQAMATAQPTEVPQPTQPAARPTSAAPATPAPSATPAPIATPAPSATPAPPPPPAGPVLIAAGQFHNVVHVGTGDALVYRQPDGSHVLRLENLDVENGPDLYLYVVAAPDSDNAETVEAAGFLSLGLLKGNQGNQTYELPAEYDPALHRSVTIWCRRFAVNFVTAPLAAQ
jgi:hypothetical protein